MKKGIAIALIVLIVLTFVAIIYRRSIKKITTPTLGELPVETTQEPSGGSEESSDTPIAPPVASGTTPAPAEVTMTLSSPVNNSTVSSPTVTVKGKTIANAEVFVNEGETKSDTSGNFSYQVTLDEGENIIVVLVNDEAGNMAEQELTLTYQPK